MLFLIWGILILLGLVFPKSKILTALMLTFMVVSICFRTQGADWIIYNNEFNWSIYQEFSDVHYVGYLVLEQFAHSMGITFDQFIVIVGLISTMLFFCGARKLTTNVNLVLALFFLYPFSHEAVQVRTFLANSIIVFALPLILKEPIINAQKNSKKIEKKGIRLILFYILAVLACTFHFEAVFYVVCLTLMLFLPEKYSRIYIFGGAIVLFLLIEIDILPIIISRFNTRIAYWLSGKTGLGIIIPIFITLVIWYGMQLSGKYCIVKTNDTNECGLYKRLLRLSDFIIFLIPLFCYDITFNRLWRLFLFIFYIMVATLLPYKINKNKRMWIIFILVIVFVSVCIYENVFSILYGFFENNEIFKGSSVF